MFGYIRPMQGELKVRDLERFKACYCGLCHTLGKNYGFAARFILSYELVFLAMLLWKQDQPPVMKRGRCIAAPCRAKRYCSSSEALDYCAGYSIILTRWKLRDTIADENFIKTIPHRLLSVILSGAYKKAARLYPRFEQVVKTELVELAGYEGYAEVSLDGVADKFASILIAAVPDGIKESERRPLLELLYHLGRWIYIVDACDDFVDDSKANRYNPIAAWLEQAVSEQNPPPIPSQKYCIPEQGLDRLKVTLTHSNNLINSAFELLPENTWAEIIRNLIYLGMPDACSRVLEGKWPPRRQIKERT